MLHIKSFPRTKNRMPDKIGSGSAGASAFPSRALCAGGGIWRSVLKKYLKKTVKIKHIWNVNLITDNGGVNTGHTI